MDDIVELKEPENEDTYANRLRTRHRTAAVAKPGQAVRGRKRTAQALPYEVAGDAEKPYACKLCGLRYKTRPGLTYHHTQTHKEGAAHGETQESAPSAAVSSEYQDCYVTFLNNPTVAPSGSSRRPKPRSVPAESKTHIAEKLVSCSD